MTDSTVITQCRRRTQHWRSSSALFDTDGLTWVSTQLAADFKHQQTSIFISFLVRLRHCCWMTAWRPGRYVRGWHQQVGDVDWNLANEYLVYQQLLLDPC